MEHLTEEEYHIISEQLENRFVGMEIFNDDHELVKIVAVYVDYRKARQDMNRVADEWGNIHFISELEDKILFGEV